MAHSQPASTADQALPFSPQGVRKTFVNSHQLPTVELGICAGQLAEPPLTTGTHLCGRISGGSRNSTDAGHRSSTRITGRTWN